MAWGRARGEWGRVCRSASRGAHAAVKTGGPIAWSPAAGDWNPGEKTVQVLREAKQPEEKGCHTYCQCHSGHDLQGRAGADSPAGPAQQGNQEREPETARTKQEHKNGDRSSYADQVQTDLPVPGDEQRGCKQRNGKAHTADAKKEWDEALLTPARMVITISPMEYTLQNKEKRRQGDPAPRHCLP